MDVVEAVMDMDKWLLVSRQGMHTELWGEERPVGMCPRGRSRGNGGIKWILERARS